MASTSGKSDLLSQIRELRELISENTKRIERLEAMGLELVEEEVIEEVIIMPPLKSRKVDVKRARMPKA
jgi:hypothetical protein